MARIRRSAIRSVNLRSRDQSDRREAMPWPMTNESTSDGQALPSTVGRRSDRPTSWRRRTIALLRLQAEMQNLRNRTSREIADERKYAALPVLRDLLPVLDNIDRAIEAAEKAGEAENLLAGFRLVRQQLETISQPARVRADRAGGRAVRPALSPGDLAAAVGRRAGRPRVMVTQPGYKLHDRVVRPAQVIVSSGPPTS